MVRFTDFTSVDFLFILDTFKLIKYDKLLLIDKDGVLVKSIRRRETEKGSPRNLFEFRYEKKIIETFKLFKKNRIGVIVITNQPDLQNEKMNLSTFRNMNFKLIKDLNLIGIICCPHKKEQNCKCRKPNTKMVDFVLGLKKINRNKVIYGGDRETDVEMGLNAKIKTFHIKKECINCKKSIKHFDSLYDSCSYIISSLK